MENNDWDFTLANYGPVWGLVVQLGLLLLFLMLGNVLRRKIPLFRNCLVPSALLGGAMLLIIKIISNQFNFEIVDNRIMQVVTYHCLAIGFAAMSLKTEKSNHKTKKSQVVEFGALQGGTYMLQAFMGIGITIILFLITRYSENIISYICGLLLPLGFGQGPGNALSWDINFTNTPAALFAGNGSVGLSLASIGFIVASVFGVLYINIHKKKGTLIIREFKPDTQSIASNNTTDNEIPDSESIDKFSVQMGFVALAYALSFGFMCLLGVISDFTNSIAWGFNFLWASLAAILIKSIVNKLRKKKIMNRVYINNYQMDRISGFAFDLMIVAGVAAIEINDIKRYLLPIIILSIVGAAITYLYIRLVAKHCFKGFEHEFFLMSFGTLTGTASNGMILMKEIDPNLKTPTSSLYILSNFPGMIMIAPLLLLLGFAAKSLTHAIIACAIFFVLWVVYSMFLFRRKIFKKKYKDNPAPVWTDEEQKPVETSEEHIKKK
jgi:ESS family glutamate:Na+ symporter